MHASCILNGKHSANTLDIVFWFILGNEYVFRFHSTKAQKVEAKGVRCLFYICFSEPKVMTLFHKSFGNDSMGKNRGHKILF